MSETKLTSDEQKLADDLLWGLAEIADFLGFRNKNNEPDLHQCHYKLSKGQLPAKQIGNVWVSSKSMLRRFILEGMDSPRKGDAACSALKNYHASAGARSFSARKGLE
ncbi:hypothetical protein I6F15_04525 [Bradyrhizobium sp. BRP14]|nr:hypothetical protein [Bradyrhizobium sp. BRP14]